jgi:hypothetical protein
VVLKLEGGRGANKCSAKNNVVMKCYTGLRIWTDSKEKRPELRKMDKGFGTSNKYN